MLKNLEAFSNYAHYQGNYKASILSEELIPTALSGNQIEVNGQWHELRWQFRTARYGHSNLQKTMISSVVISLETLIHRVDSLTSINGI